MKVFRITVLPVLLFAAFLAFPVTSTAGSLPSDDSGSRVNGQEATYQQPNLNATDGFDESEHKRKVRKKNKKTVEKRPVEKHNL